MPAQLLAYVDHAIAKTTRATVSPTSKESNALKKIFTILRMQTGHDFSLYKPTTVVRRIERRKAVNQIDKTDEYARYLEQNTKEIEFLFRDMLVGVTNFFRDRDAFTELVEEVIPRLFLDKTDGAEVRIWVPGCATGEEAYSIAILIQEHLSAVKQNFRVQVFASDIDSRAIETARAGIYPASISRDVTNERLDRFFTFDKEANTYQIRKKTREIIVTERRNPRSARGIRSLGCTACLRRTKPMSPVSARRTRRKSQTPFGPPPNDSS